MTSRQAKLQEDTNFRVLRLLQENLDLTQRELADQLGVSVGGVNYCLRALMEKACPHTPLNFPTAAAHQERLKSNWIWGVGWFVPDDWLHGLDFSTLEPYPGSYITEDFRNRADDVVWRNN